MLLHDSKQPPPGWLLAVVLLFVTTVSCWDSKNLRWQLLSLTRDANHPADLEIVGIQTGVGD